MRSISPALEAGYASAASRANSSTREGFQVPARHLLAQQVDYDPKETAVIRSFRRGAHPLAPGSKQPPAMISGDLTPHYDRLLRRTLAGLL